MSKLSKIEQDKLIQEELDRLHSIFINLPSNKKEVAKKLIERIAFMTIQLEILEDTIKTKGPTYMFQNGAQNMLIENPAQKSYNTTMNRYTAAYDKLFHLVDKIEAPQSVEDEEDV
ncbi:hypothetical protein [Bacillus mycoides]|uniref:hypothetical protein n=1 Tax=Bacillus mycoides TaxID=1405 RepID=UPI002112048A|nr:hypothetical protein [Bacillus mycoides]MCQ6530759.1 hypothetical protein [Bacillus mycoides]